MAKKASVRNRTNKNTETASARADRKRARDNGRGRNQAYSSGARSVSPGNDNAYRMIEAWRENQSNRNGSTGQFKKKGTGGNVATLTSSTRGRLSEDGRTAGGKTWTMTAKDENGNTIAQSGRNKTATRRQRYYDVRVGLGLAGG